MGRATSGRLAAVPAHAPPELPPPRRMRHYGTLLWWLALVGLGTGLYWLPDLTAPPPAPPKAVERKETEAFVALLFGKVAREDARALEASTLRGQLEAMRHSGYHTVGLAEIEHFLRDGVPLPVKPILLTFDRARRDMLEMIDPLLRDLGMRAVVFADVPSLAEANLELVSIHRLRQLVETGRWEVAVSGCLNVEMSDARSVAAALAPAVYRSNAQLLSSWIGSPVLAVDCQRSWPDGTDAGALWARALQAGGFRLGFVVSPGGTNYQDDLPFHLRRLHVSRDWKGRELVSQIEAHAPRRTEFVDDVTSGRRSPAWTVDHGNMDVEDGNYVLYPREADTGAVAFLGGTERWRDVAVEVELASLPRGQFWIYTRRDSGNSFVRLGIAEKRVVLQASAPDGKTKQLASRPLSSSDRTFRIQVTGDKVRAEVNGKPIANRPSDTLGRAKRGPVAIAVWDGDAPGKAKATIRRIAAEPLGPICALLPPSPSSKLWEETRRRLPEFTMLSPLYYEWSGGVSREPGKRDSLLEVLARFGRVEFLPAVRIVGRPAPSELGTLERKIVEWAKNPAYDGINVVFDAELRDPQWLSFVAGLRNRVRAEGKALVVTALGANDAWPGTPTRWEGLFRVAAPEIESLVVARAKPVLIDSLR